METVINTNPLDALRWKKETKTADDNNNGMLDQADFFALLTQQLANQDPTKPVDNNEMISQMTGFSTTDGIATLNDSFNLFSASMSSSQALQASSLVGRSVLVDDNVFGMAEGAGANGKIKTDLSASNVVIYVENTAGEIIQTVPVGSIKKGEYAFTWDGKDGNGETAPTGAYRFRVAGIVDGEAAELQALTYRKVDSVTLAGAGGLIQLNLNGGETMALKDVLEVSS
ncbi:MAG: flagellar hook assembly protein FlgD [Colwellia sp.]|nr:flagellar hook assembly protein FlgD [Colwellia sp.]